MNSVAAQTWLILRNDLRLLWRDLRASRFKTVLNGSLIGLLFALANLVSIAIFFAVRRSPPPEIETLIWLFFAFVMLGAAMNHAIIVLFERADFDLLLASPVSPRAILIARMTSMMVAAVLSVALLLLPLLNGALLALSWRYAAGYAVLLFLSCIVASAGVWLTVLLVKWLGPRRARTWSQVLAALFGASIFIVVQAPNLLVPEVRNAVMARTMGAMRHPALAFLSRAGRGDAISLVALAIIALAFVALTTQLLAKLFVNGVQETSGITPSRRRRSSRRRTFSNGIFRATFWKDLRLIARDPLLLAQILPMCFYILPAFFGMSRFGGVNLLAPLTLFITAPSSAMLTFVSAAGEECWDLIRMSPTAELRLRIAKMAAGMALPLLFGFALCLTLALLGRPWLALLTFIFSFGCAAACSWLQVTDIKPTPRRDVLKRSSSNRNFGRGLVAGILCLMGAAGLGTASSSHWMAATVILGLTALSIIACFVLVEMKEISSSEFSRSDSAVSTTASE